MERRAAEWRSSATFPYTKGASPHESAASRGPGGRGGGGRGPAVPAALRRRALRRPERQHAAGPLWLGARWRCRAGRQARVLARPESVRPRCVRAREFGRSLREARGVARRRVDRVARRRPLYWARGATARATGEAPARCARPARAVVAMAAVGQPRSRGCIARAADADPRRGWSGPADLCVDRRSVVGVPRSRTPPHRRTRTAGTTGYEPLARRRAPGRCDLPRRALAPQRRGARRAG